MSETVLLINRPTEGFRIGGNGARPINAAMAAGAQLCSTDPDFGPHSLTMFDAGIQTARWQGKKILDIRSSFGTTGDRAFLRDCFALIAGKAVVAKFAFPERQGEEAWIERIIRPEFIVRLEDPNTTFEGGDYRPTPFGVHLVGHSARTNAAAHAELQRLFPDESFLFLALKDRHLGRDAMHFHLDDETFVSETGEASHHAEAFTGEANAAFCRLLEAHGKNTRHGEDIYYLTPEQALALASNLKSLGAGQMLAPKLDADIAAFWKRHGKTVHQSDIAHFKHARGGWNCLIHEISVDMLTDEARAELARQMAEVRSSQPRRQAAAMMAATR